jgi:hypothetical protein
MKPPRQSGQLIIPTPGAEQTESKAGRPNAMILRILLAVTLTIVLMPANAGKVFAQEDTTGFDPALTLVMMEEVGCRWCATWNAEIGPIYPKTAEGQAAPLTRLDVHDPLPAGLTLKRAAFYTPTFILVRDGTELARIEGYPGEDFFWGLLGVMLKKHSDFTGAS